MYYRFDKYLVNEFITYLRRVFRYNTEWANKDLELVQFPSGSGPLVFEQFFEENEKYPIIVVSSNGGNYTNVAFNDFIGSYDNDDILFGDRSLQYVVVGETSKLAVQLPLEAYSETLRGVWVNMAWSGAYSGGDDLQVFLYKGYDTTKTLVSSASVPGTTCQVFKRVFSEFYPYVALNDTDYWMEIFTSAGSTYNIGIDTNSTTYYDSGGIRSTGSIDGSLVLTPFLRYGGHYEGSFSIRCMAKNDTSTARNLSELSAQYILLAKHAKLDRTTDSINGLLNDVLHSVDGEWFGKGFYIKGVHQGVLENRRRGENDVIFISSITVDVFSEWFQDYPATSIKDIDVSDTIFS